jgi:hypothetical protein
MTIQTKHNLGEAITVMVDGTEYTGTIREIHIYARTGEMDIATTYSAEVSKQFKNKDGTYRTDTRNWIGKDGDIL